MTGVALAVAGFWAALAAVAWLRLRARMGLVARACHELRSPLCAARLAVAAAVREEGSGGLAAIDRELARAGLVLADLSAARSGTHAADTAGLVDVDDLLREAGATWSSLAWPLGAAVRVEPGSAGLVLRGDRLRLLQAVGNLVGNALEHGRGDVVLRARAVGGAVRLEVDDMGPGLTAPVSELVRRPRGGRGSRGRGLAIASDIAARHGGRVVAAPAPAGARMVLELPAQLDLAGDPAQLVR